MGLSVFSKRFLVITASVALLGVAGCGGEKKSQEVQAPQQQQSAAQGQAGQAMPGGQPQVDPTQDQMNKVQHANIKTQKTVAISDAVKAKWKEAKLEITETASKSTGTVTVKVGGDVKLKEGVRLKVDSIVPDYAIAGNNIESRSNDAKNPAVLVELLEGDKSVAKGWIFRDFPEFNSFSDSRFIVKLVIPAPAAASAKK